MLKDKIQQNLIEALKEKDTKRVSVLRFLQSYIKNKEIEKHADLSDEEVIQIIRKQIKELADAKIMFAQGGRDDLVKENEAQIAILQEYLPEEISDEELRHEIETIVKENIELASKNPKALIGIAISKLKTKADAQRIRKMLEDVQDNLS